MAKPKVYLNGRAALTMNGYQADTQVTAMYPEDKAFEYLIAGIGGEVGELQSKYAKYIRDDLDFTQVKEGMKAELGDILWFIAQIAKKLDYNLQSVAEDNTKKLNSRLLRNKISGDGDNR
tara:strand:- start:97 stop:456 length:360 start_codon:yes stop_codon:yes gene_type:complete